MRRQNFGESPLCVGGGREKGFPKGKRLGIQNYPRSISSSTANDLRKGRNPSVPYHSRDTMGMGG